MGKVKGQEVVKEYNGFDNFDSISYDGEGIVEAKISYPPCTITIKCDMNDWKNAESVVELFYESMKDVGEQICKSRV